MNYFKIELVSKRFRLFLSNQKVKLFLDYLDIVLLLSSRVRKSSKARSHLLVKGKLCLSLFY
jgi:hypothetical protein